MSDIRRWQRRYVGFGLAILPLAPLLFLQGEVTRWKVGVLPDAGGGREGMAGTGGDPARLLVIGESTVAGVGARTHEEALAGQFAERLSEHIGRAVSWHVIGRSGVTARRTIDELVPLIPDQQFEYILLGIGGNDVLTLSSPVKWRRDMTELLGTLRRLQPDAVIFITNCPMIVASPVLPQPIKGILWRLSQMHNDNAVEFTRDMDRVLYYRQPGEFDVEGFFADGIHPSEQGYRDWAAAMIRYFSETYEW